MPRRAIVPTFCLGALLLVGLKLGNSASARWASLFPDGIWDWVFAGWPPTLAPVLAGIALLAVTTACSPVAWEDLKRYRHVLLPIAGMLAVSLIGMINTTSWEVATSFTAHLLAVLAFALALILHLRSFPETRNVLLTCWLLGLALLCLEVVHQVFWGFDEVRASLQYQMEYEAAELPEGLMFNVLQGRAMASFAISNSLAAHLILVLPPAAAVIWRWARRVEPPLPSQIILSALVAAVLGGCLFATRSRAAFVALFLGAAATAVLIYAARPERLQKHLKWLVPAVFAGIVIFIAGYLRIQGTRSASSLSARLDYWQAAWQMFCAHPLAGVGIGEFFHRYMTLKPPGAEETKLAHSVFYHFLSQCGILGGAAAVYFAVSSLLVYRQVVRRELKPVSSPEFYAALFGVLAWTAHSLVDFNIHIPATVMLVPALLIFAIPPPAPVPQPAGQQTTLLRVLIMMIALAALAQGWKLPGEAAFRRLDDKLNVDHTPPEYLTAEIENVARKLPLSPHPWLKAGYAYLAYGRYDQAADAYRKAIARDPHFASAHYRLALALYLLGDLKESEAELDIALALYPHKDRYTALWRHLQHRKHGNPLPERLQP